MKQTLKQDILQKRDALSKKEIEEKSLKVKEQLYNLEEFKNAKNILCYVSFNSEVETQEMIKELLEKNEKTVVVPFVEKNNPYLQLSELHKFEELKPKTMGILEPSELYIREFNPDEIGMVIVPGLVFAKDGHRIGYGYGYYDRFLKALRHKPVKIGLSFECQLVDKIPFEPHDVPMDITITEERSVRIKK